MAELPVALQGGLIFIFGCLFGSFGNVVIYRLPKGQNIAWPGSHCQSCQAAVRWYDNIPILSWVLLRGKCRQCQAPFSIRYPIVEGLMGLLFLASFLKFGLSWFLLEVLIFTFCAVVASFIDLDHMILPNQLTLSGIVIGLIGAFLNPEREFLPAFLGVLVGGGFLWAIAYFYFAIRKQEGMGGGDIKLIAWIGALLGWSAIPFVILASSLFGSLIGLSIVVKSKGDMKSVIPFGPYLVLGAFLYLFFGVEISEWYLDLFIPGLSDS